MTFEAHLAKQYSADLGFVLSLTFMSKVAVIVAVSSCPLYVIKMLQKRFKPAAYAKLAET